MIHLETLLSQQRVGTGRTLPTVGTQVWKEGKESPVASDINIRMHHCPVT